MIKYEEWLKTNPDRGYYWVKVEEESEPSVDEYTIWYDNAGNEETKFTVQPEYVCYPVPSYQEMVEHDDKCCCLRNEVLEVENAKLRKKLDIAVKALKKYGDVSKWYDIEWYDDMFCSCWFVKDNGYEIAQKALEKIKENKE